MPVDIEGLTSCLASQLALDLAQMDAALVLELGATFSHEPWSADAFCAAREGKWQLSYVALDEGRLAGYWIASSPAPGTVHVHRVGVAATRRGEHLGGRLLEHGILAARELGASRITLSLGFDNHGARRFYEQHGFVMLVGEALRAYAADHQIVLDPSRDRLMVDGHGYAAMALTIT